MEPLPESSRILNYGTRYNEIISQLHDAERLCARICYQPPEPFPAPTICSSLLLSKKSYIEPVPPVPKGTDMIIEVPDYNIWSRVEQMYLRGNLTFLQYIAV